MGEGGGGFGACSNLRKEEVDLCCLFYSWIGIRILGGAAGGVHSVI